MSTDPVDTDPGLYRVIFENDRVRVLEYTDRPGDLTHVHTHPDTVMYTLSSFGRRLIAGDQEVDVELEAGAVRWLDAQQHAGENIGATDTHAIFIELKEPRPGPGPSGAPLGPST